MSKQAERLAVRSKRKRERAYYRFPLPLYAQPLLRIILRPCSTGGKQDRSERRGWTILR